MELRALVAIQEALESYVIGVFEDSQKLAIHAHRQTVMPKDTELANEIRNGNNQGSTATPGISPPK
jgi:histone H3/H4